MEKENRHKRKRSRETVGTIRMTETSTQTDLISTINVSCDDAEVAVLKPRKQEKMADGGEVRINQTTG